MTTARTALIVLLAACSSTETVTPELGTLDIEVAMSGADVDRDGVVIALDGTTSVTLPSNGTYTFTGVTVGPHTVRLEGATPNCLGSAPFQRTVTVAQTAVTVQFALTCSKVPLAASGLIAFVRGDVDQTGDLWIMNPDGTGETKVRPSPGIGDLSPSWTPDGQRIVFQVAQLTGQSSIAIIDRNGGGFTPLTAGPGTSYSPSVSPDGRQIAFVGQLADALPSQIWVMGIDGSNPRQLTTGGGFKDQPAWSPDGTQIVYAEEGSLLIISSATGAQLFRPSGLTEKSDNAPAWSPDGTTIAFQRHVDGQPFIFTMTPTGNFVTRLTPLPGNDESPSWSRDGSHIAFASGRTHGFGVWSMDSHGGDLRRLSTGTYESMPSWSR